MINQQIGRIMESDIKEAFRVKSVKILAKLFTSIILFVVMISGIFIEEIFYVLLIGPFLTFPLYMLIFFSLESVITYTMPDITSPNKKKLLEHYVFMYKSFFGVSVFIFIALSLIYYY